MLVILILMWPAWNGLRGPADPSAPSIPRTSVQIMTDHNIQAGLSDISLHNMLAFYASTLGTSEPRPYKVCFASSERLWLHDFTNSRPFKLKKASS